MSIQSSIKKMQLIKEEVDLYTDIEKLKSYAESKAAEYKDAALSAVMSKVGLATSALPMGAGAVATAAALQAKIIMSDVADVAEKAYVLALLAQKIQQLTQEAQKLAQQLPQ